MLQCNIFSYKHYDTVKERNDKMALLIKADAKKSYLLSYNYGLNRSYFHERAFRWCNH